MYTNVNIHLYILNHYSKYTTDQLYPKINTNKSIFLLSKPNQPTI